MNNMIQLKLVEQNKFIYVNWSSDNAKNRAKELALEFNECVLIYQKPTGKIYLCIWLVTNVGTFINLRYWI